MEAPAREGALGPGLAHPQPPGRRQEVKGAPTIPATPRGDASAGRCRLGVPLATIDLGSNTVRYLLVDLQADGTWRALDQDQRVTRVGEGLAATGRLGEAPMARTAAAVAEYCERARGRGADEVIVVATSAVREAANGRAFAADLARATGVDVTIVSGEDEARLTVQGVLAGLPDSPTPLMVFDIGGGSTEFILWSDGGVAASASLRLGVVPLAERHPFPGLVETEEYRALVAEIAARLASELPLEIADTRVGTLVGTAGTVTTLAALDLRLRAYDPERVNGHRLTRAAVDRERARLAALTVEGRAALPCLEPGRADLIVPGVAIVEATMDHLGTAALIVSDWSLREGMVAEWVTRWR